MSDAEPRRLFPASFNDQFRFGDEGGNCAFFGTNVLAGLVEGIEEFVQLREARWKQFRSLGPALLGSAMWIDDPKLIETIGQLSGACVVITKQGRARWERERLQRLDGINSQTPGLPIRAFALLSGLAPKVQGRPAFVGPYDREYDGVVPTFRTLSYRKTDRADMPPIVHAKLALLGHLWWHDEGVLGHVEDVIGFKAKRLWISSANFTASSRRSLEFGYWTEESALVEGAKRFLVALMGSSEALDPEADFFEPDLAEVEYDDDAMREALAEMDLEPSDEVD